MSDIWDIDVPQSMTPDRDYIREGGGWLPNAISIQKYVERHNGVLLKRQQEKGIYAWEGDTTDHLGRRNIMIGLQVGNVMVIQTLTAIEARFPDMTYLRQLIAKGKG